LGLGEKRREGEIPFGTIVQLVVPGEHRRGPIGIRGESHFPEMNERSTTKKAMGKIGFKRNGENHGGNDDASLVGNALAMPQNPVPVLRN